MDVGLFMTFDELDPKEIYYIEFTQTHARDIIGDLIKSSPVICKIIYKNKWITQNLRFNFIVSSNMCTKIFQKKDYPEMYL